MVLPMDAIFNTINELMELAKYVVMPISSTQVVSFTYVYGFQKYPSLLQDIRAFIHLAFEHRTWENMKINHRDAQKDLLSLSVASQIYPQANSLIPVESISPCNQITCQ